MKLYPRVSDDGITWEPYEPQLVYFPHSDCLEFVLEDTTVVYDEVAPGISLLRDLKGRKVIGFKIEGSLARHVLKAPARHFDPRSPEQAPEAEWKEGIEWNR